MDEAVRAERRQLRLAQLGESLHDLCQPLTALQCRLEIAQMGLELPGNSDAPPSAPAPDLLAECLRECGRLNASVTTMRSLVRKARAEEQETDG